MVYAGLFNSSYKPSPVELIFINTPVDQLGPPLLGQIFVTLLQGVLFVQYYNYLILFWNEKRWTRWIIHIVFLLCLLKFVYVMWFSWDRFVPHYGDWLYMSIFSPIAVPIGISSALPGAFCQAYYIHRCWALSRNWFFLIPSISTLLLSLGSSIALTWGAAEAAGGILHGLQIITNSATLSLASALACDIWITAFTCYYLISQKTGFTRTDGLISRLVKVSLESAVGPTTVAIANLVLSNRSTNNQWFLVPTIALSHVYSCSLLYTVNARKEVQDKTSLMPNFSGTPASGGGSGTRNSRNRPPTSYGNGVTFKKMETDIQLEELGDSPIGDAVVSIHTIRHENNIVSADHTLSKYEEEQKESVAW